MRSLVALMMLLGVGCGAEPPGNGDVVGPYTGPIQRYVVDDFLFPRSNDEARQLGDDLDGDRVPDNQAGLVIVTMMSVGDVTPYVRDILAAGVVASSVEIQADDSTDDPSVAVRYLGSEGAPSEVAGGRFEGGVFTSNRTRTTLVPGRARLHLPVLIDADPLVLDLDGMQMSLEPDGAGYRARIQGVLPVAHVRQVVAQALYDMMASNPAEHGTMIGVFDKDVNGVVTLEEITSSNSFLTLLQPDLEMFDDDGRFSPGRTTWGRDDALSIGFEVHLSPCASGRCATSPPVHTCFDRIQDGDETGVDCGGSCRACVLR